LNAQYDAFFLLRIGSKMQTPEGTKPAVMGAAAGAIGLAIVGFNWGGWVTGGSASIMSDENSVTAVASALTPYCVQKSENDPKSNVVMTELDEANSYERRRIVENAGWATPLGAKNPDSDLAQACQIALSKDT
jgi:hypothetical protein